MEARTADSSPRSAVSASLHATYIRDLSVARQQTVEIVKALASDVRVLVMDEPTAPLADHEAGLLHDLVRRLAGAAASASCTSRTGCGRSSNCRSASRC